MTKLDKWRIGIVILGGLIVLLCSMYISFGHSVNLVKDYRQVGKSAYAIVIMLETAFLTFSISTALSKLQGKTMRWFEWIFFSIGLTYVGWSNLHAFPSNIGGVVLGLSIPLYLFIMEVMLSNIIISIMKESPLENKEVEPMDDKLVEETPMERVKEVEGLYSPMEDKPSTPKKKTPPPPSGEDGDVEKWIEQYLDDNGKLPTRKIMVDNKVCSDWIARKSIAKYKKKLA